MNKITDEIMIVTTIGIIDSFNVFKNSGVVCSFEFFKNIKKAIAIPIVITQLDIKRT